MKHKRCLSRDPERLRNYFGRSSRNTTALQAGTMVVSRQFDNGLSYEILMTRRSFVEYELSHADPEHVEYVVPGGYTDYELLDSKQANRASWGQSTDVIPFHYIEPFDAGETHQATNPEKPCSCREHPAQRLEQESPAVQAPRNEPPASRSTPAPSPVKPSPPPVATAEQANETPDSRNQSYFPDTANDDFLADMQAIISGKKGGDPKNKKVKSKDAEPGRVASIDGEQPLVPLEAKSEHAIFDKIAQSMRYANAYDLGSIDLEKRFSEFDRVADKPKNKPNHRREQTEQGEDHSTADFLRDLDDVRQASLRSSGKEHSIFLSEPEALALSLPNSPLVGTPWWNTNLGAKQFFTDEPQSNIDQFTIPPSVNADNFYRDFAAAHPNHAATIIGDRGQAVAAQYFVIHDRGDNVHTEAPASVADINPAARGTHLYIGFQRVLRVNDWHEAGDGTKLESRSNTCFVHVELTQHPRGTEEVRENGTLIKAAGTRFTIWQYDMLAYAYIVASLRRRRFLTVTVHREVDRALEGGHGDPRDFDVNFFYQRINDLLGLGATSGFTFGIQQNRITALRQVNMGGYINEFLPYAAGSTHAANQYGAPRRNPDGSWSHHPRPAAGPACGNGNLFNQTT